MRQLFRDDTISWASPQQQQAMVAVLEKRTDVVAILRTGGGKSMLAIIPSILEINYATVLVLPLNSLIMDFEHRLKRMGVPFQVYDRNVNSGSLNPRDNLILVTADKCRTDGWRESIAILNEQKPIARIVFDEAHIPLIASDYRNALEHIDDIRSLPVQIVLLTGTMPRSSETDLKKAFNLGSTTIIRQCTNREELSYILEKLPHNDLVQRACRIVEQEQVLWQDSDRALVFVTTLELGQIAACKFQCPFYNGNKDLMTDEERRAAYRLWVTGVSKVMVATSAFSTGNDYPNVRLTIHLDRPFEMLEFIQGQGRAGRDGMPAKCYTLVPPTAFSPQPTPAPDHKGVVAMHQHLYLFGLKRCLRYGITLHNDGAGIRCRSLPSNQLCIVCASDVNHDPTEIRIAQMPKSRSMDQMVCTTAPRIVQMPAEIGRPSGTAAFVASMNHSNSLRSGRQQEVAQHAHRVRRALQCLTYSCVFCTVMQGEAIAGHDLHTCPCLDMHENPSQSWGHYLDWRKQLQYTRKHKKICFMCHVPQINDALHPTFAKAKSGGPCEFADIIAPAAFGIFHNNKLRTGAMEHFGQEWPGITHFTGWLIAPPNPGSYSNIIDLVLWYVDANPPRS